MVLYPQWNKKENILRTNTQIRWIWIIRRQKILFEFVKRIAGFQKLTEHISWDMFFRHGSLQHRYTMFQEFHHLRVDVAYVFDQRESMLDLVLIIRDIIVVLFFFSHDDLSFRLRLVWNESEIHSAGQCIHIVLVWLAPNNRIAPFWKIQTMSDAFDFKNVVRINYSLFWNFV